MTRPGEPPGTSAEPLHADRQRRALQASVDGAELTLEQLWLRYFTLGGEAGPVEIEAYLAGLLPLPLLQGDLLAHAVNEHLDELLAARRVPYSTDREAGRPAHRPLTALLELLRDSHLVAPDRLAALVDTTARTLGVRAVPYLVDHDQRVLVPLPGPGAHDRGPLPVDSTLAGQAFRQVETVATTTDGQARLWVPMLDGLQRLGVLDALLPDPSDLADPLLRAECEALATLLAHLVTTAGARGDALDAVRRSAPRSPAAELVWQLLPPPNAGTEMVSVAGWVLPTERVGGDAFDYSLSETAVQLAIFDAMGHGLTAGLVSTTAVTAYRNARRNGADLSEQVRAIDSAVAEQFGDGTFATGVLVELDLVSGRLLYCCAGHPPPFLLRDSRVVKRLDGALRVPFGLDREDVALAEERLQPGDWLVLHTDGITEARDSAGALFGEPRFIDLLERQAASGQPPPETVRRLSHAVLGHQNGVLQDDATIVLAAWTSPGSSNRRP